VLRSAKPKPMGTKLLIYDGTRRKGESLLRTAWALGSKLYRLLGRVDASYSAKSWADALTWLTRQGEHACIDEIQFWGHGTWGNVYIANDILSIRSLCEDHVHYALLQTLKGKLRTDGSSLVWFRTCETFGAAAGQAFAAKLTRLLNAKAAGHTHIIGVWQSGLHGLNPGEAPHWSASEGLKDGSAENPKTAHGSWPNSVRSLHFMNGEIPEAWFRSAQNKPDKLGP
jgi:hypothetical protein